MKVISPTLILGSILLICQREQTFSTFVDKLPTIHVFAKCCRVLHFLNWTNVTPKDLPEAIVNSIEVSPHDPATAYITVMAYKFNNLKPMVYKTTDYGVRWVKRISGIDDQTVVRVVREDKKVEGLLYAGTEAGLYISFNGGVFWQKMQLNLPIVPINDLTIQDNDLVAATAGRSFWILDDLGAFQGSKGKFEKELMLFQPKKTHRIFGGSTDEPRPGLGQNPKSGVLIPFDQEL